MQGLTCSSMMIGQFETVILTDGQKIATRLTRRITVVSKLLKKSLASYNSGIDLSCQLTWNEVISLSSYFYRDCLYSDHNSPVPAVVKYQAVQMHHQIARSEEEVARIKSEMSNCVNHYISVHECLLEHVEAFKQSEDSLWSYNLGKLCLLKRAMKKCLYKLQSLQCFLNYTELEQLQSVLTSLSDQLEHEEQYVLVQDDVDQNIHSIGGCDTELDRDIDPDNNFDHDAYLDHDTGLDRDTDLDRDIDFDHDIDLYQRFDASDQDKSSNPNCIISNLTNSFTSTGRSTVTVLIQDNDSVSLDNTLTSTSTTRSSQSSVAALQSNVLEHQVEADVDAEESFVLGQSSNVVKSSAVDQEAGLDCDTNALTSSLLLQSEDEQAYVNVAASNQAADSHQPVFESSSEESDEEMIMQDWRRNRFLRETYLDSIRNTDDDLGSLITNLEQSTKVKITERKKEPTVKPVSYLNIPREVLQESLHQIELAEKRAEKRERLQRLLNSGPFFQIN